MQLRNVRMLIIQTEIWMTSNKGISTIKIHPLDRFCLITCLHTTTVKLCIYTRYTHYGWNTSLIMPIDKEIHFLHHNNINYYDYILICVIVRNSTFVISCLLIGCLMQNNLPYCMYLLWDVFFVICSFFFFIY